jgi:SAM-dependent methyltransferase
MTPRISASAVLGRESKPETDQHDAARRSSHAVERALADSTDVLRYERIGPGYARGRRAEPRIAGALDAALGDARTVVNVGAGTGSYEPVDRTVLAVEPSAAMRAQRSPTAAPCVEAFAERLPFADGSFDAALAVYSDFHWDDPGRGIAELVRVSRERVVVLTVDRAIAERYWLTRDYLPGGSDLFRDLESVTSALPGDSDVTTVPIPHDCCDEFVHAFWRRPRALLDDRLRATMAMFDRLEPAAVDLGLARLRADLDSGAWGARNGELCGLDALDLGHRLVVWRRGALGA